VFTANAHYVFGCLSTWGWITLIVGALQLLAAGGVLAGNQLARWFAVVVLGLNAIDLMFFVPPTRSGPWPSSPWTWLRSGAVCLRQPGEPGRLGTMRSASGGTVVTPGFAEGADMNDERGTGNGWTVVLRRRPVRIAEGRPEGGYTEEFEIAALFLLGPAAIGVGVLGGAAAGALHHKGLGLTGTDRERIGKELIHGKAAVGVLTPFNESSMISAKLSELGGASEEHTVSDEALNASQSAHERVAACIRQRRWPAGPRDRARHNIVLCVYGPPAEI
jgi:hypothetical protein